jgi:hypothetical protein
MGDRQRLIEECRTLKDGGVDLENVISYLRKQCCWKIDSIHESLGISLGDAKRIVHLSSTWEDTRENDDALHGEIIDALAAMPGVTIEEH